MDLSPAPVARITDEDARRELWLSFCSLVRAYVAAAQVGIEPPLALVAQPDPDQLQLVSPTRTIQLLAQPGQSSGYWAIYQAPPAAETPVSEGAFRIGLDSLIEWTGLPGSQEMDAIAETLATLILE